MEHLQKTKIPEATIGDWRIERFRVSKKQAAYFNMRCMIAMNGIGAHRTVSPGTYTRLMRKGSDYPIMSDTPAELRDHELPVEMAGGRCLINGLGLGIVVEACLRKDIVEDVTVIEKSGEVCDLVAQYLYSKWGSNRLVIRYDDAMTYQPPRGIRYDMVWHDIWDEIDPENLEQMRTLHKRYQHRAKWQGSWSQSECRRVKRMCR